MGAATLREAELLRPDCYSLGACAVDAGVSITAFSFDEAILKRSVANVSKTMLVAATADKLGTAALNLVLPSARLSHLVLKRRADTTRAAAFTALGVKLLQIDASNHRITKASP